MIFNDVDLLFCNEAELKLLYGTFSLDEAIRRSANDVQMLVCTIAERGAIILEKGNIAKGPLGRKYWLGLIIL